MFIYLWRSKVLKLKLKRLSMGLAVKEISTRCQCPKIVLVIDKSSTLLRGFKSIKRMTDINDTGINKTNAKAYWKTCFKVLSKGNYFQLWWILQFMFLHFQPYYPSSACIAYIRWIIPYNTRYRLKMHFEYFLSLRPRTPWSQPSGDSVERLHPSSPSEVFKLQHCDLAAY